MLKVIFDINGLE